MPVIDLGNLENRAIAVANGSIWSAPAAAIEQAFKDIKAGRIAPPATIPDQWAGLAREMGVEPAAIGGLSEGSGPA